MSDTNGTLDTIIGSGYFLKLKLKLYTLSDNLVC